MAAPLTVAQLDDLQKDEVSVVDISQLRRDSATDLDSGQTGAMFGNSGSNAHLFGPVSSPFFFMCQYPRTGEPSGAGEEDVTLHLKFSGRKDPRDGYQPHTVYEGEFPAPTAS